MLNKSNLNNESRASVVFVAKSPRYHDGKYRSQLHPRSRKYACQVLWETERAKSNCAKPASSASRADKEVDHTVR